MMPYTELLIAIGLFCSNYNNKAGCSDTLIRCTSSKEEPSNSSTLYKCIKDYVK